MMPLTQAEEQVLATTVRDLLGALRNATSKLSGAHLATLKHGLEGLREQTRPGLQPSGFGAADPNLRQKRQAPSGQEFRSMPEPGKDEGKAARRERKGCARPPGRHPAQHEATPTTCCPRQAQPSTRRPAPVRLGTPTVPHLGVTAWSHTSCWMFSCSCRSWTSPCCRRSPWQHGLSNSRASC